MNSTTRVVRSLLKLSRKLGAEELRMAILAEGNTSAKISEERFIVKASGSSLATLTRSDLVECRSEVLLGLLERNGVSDQEVDHALLSSRTKASSKKPSVEAIFHAYCLSLQNVRYVGHTHAVAVNAILCSPRGNEFAERRVFPDEVVCCGPSSVYVPYTDPGLHLAREIRARVDAYLRQNKVVPRVILLQNHGIVTLGPTPESVWAAMLMAEKAAAIWAGAARFGGPTFLSDQDVQRIADRTDEHYRRQLLNI